MSNATEIEFNPEQMKRDILKQPYRKLYIKLNVLNFSMQNTGEISGRCIGGSVNVDANSDIRRTCKITLVAEKSSFVIEPGSEIWMDKYIQLYVGIKNINTAEILWHNMGIYIINKPSTSYSGTDVSLSFEGVDLMSKLTGLRNGQLESMTTLVKQGENLRDVIIATITQLGGFKYYAVDCHSGEVPYDIKLGVGSTVYDLLAALRDIYPNYEMFFDLNGVFIFQKIPSNVEDPVMVDDDIWKDTVLEEKIETNFEDVKNKICVLGKSIEPDDFANAIVSENQYIMILSGKKSVATGEVLGFVAPSIVENPKLVIKSDADTIVTSGDIIYPDGKFAVIPEANEYYIVSHREDGNFDFWGRQQPKYVVEDNNPSSPFSIQAIGTVYEVLSGGEYDNITTDELCKDRAEYELWRKTRLNDTITLSTVPIYWMDVNIKIKYTDKFSGSTKEYITKSISTDLGVAGYQTINAIKFYPLYPGV